MKKSVTALLPDDTAKARRLQQLASLIRAELGKLLTREVELASGVLVTITQVEVLPDFKTAHVKVSVLPFAQGKEVFILLQRVLPGLQHHLNAKLTMFQAPKLVLEFDATPERTARLEHLLDSIKSEE